MSVGIRTSLFGQSNIASQKNPRNNYVQNYMKSGAASGQGSLSKADSSPDGSIRKMESQQRTQQNSIQSVVDQSLSYANQLKASRSKSKDNSLEKKKLQYNFKKISSQIVRSKNSVSARKAVQAAKREVMRLKRLKGNGEYDDEEIQLAIDHAKSMEKLAKKKVAHLEQEEMVERAHKGAGAALEEIEERKEDTEETSKEESAEENYADDSSSMDIDDEYDATDYAAIYESMQQEIEAAQYEAQLQMEEMSAEIAENSQQIAEASSDSMSQMIDEFSEEMSEMLEALDLTDLAQSMYAPDPNMSEDDLKMLKIKHRGKEMKEIAEADKEYLKGIMEHEKNKQSSGASMPTGASSAPSSIFGSSKAPQITPIISMPGAAAGATMVAPTISGSFDVSV